MLLRELKMSERAFSISILIFGILFYARCFTFEITYLDDFAHLNHPKFPAFWLNEYESMYIPVFYQYLTFIKFVSGDYFTQVLHACSVFLHIFNALLVGVLTRTIYPNHKAAARIGSLLFLVHPVQIEVVAWLSQSRESIAVGFAILSLICFLRFMQNTRLVYYLTSLILFTVGLLTKPSIVALPLMLFLFAVGFYNGKKNLTYYVQLMIPFAALSALISTLQSSLQTSSQMLFVTQIWHRPLVAIDALSFYLAKLVVPMDLSADYGLSPKFLLSQWFLIPQVLVFIIVILGLWIWRKQTREYYVYLTAAFLSLAPVLGFIPFRFQDHSTVADHYMYFSTFFLFPVVGIWLSSCGKIVKTIFVFWFVGLLTLNLLSQNAWKNTQTAVNTGLKVNPNSEMLHSALGDHFAFEGKYAEAIGPYVKANSISPRNLSVLANLAISLTKVGRNSEAVLVADELLLRDPGNILAIQIIKNFRTGR